MKLKVLLLLFFIVMAFLTSSVSAVSISVSTNKSAYKRGETVVVTGSISGADSYPVSFIWEAKDSEGSRIDLGQETTDSSGRFSFSFVIRSSSALGKAVVIISFSGTTASKAFYIKEQSSLSISANPTSITVGGKVVISGSLTPKIQGATIKILVSSGGSWTELATVPTNGNGAYSYTWTINKEGTYRVKAKWNGNDKYFGSASKEISIKVNKPSKPKATLSISVNATKINLGEAVKVKGSLTPAKNTDIILEYKDPDGKITKFKLTAISGKFSHVLKPSKMGKWTIKAIWPGDNQYAKTESNTVSIVVKKKSSSLEIFIYPSKINVFDLVQINGALSPQLENEILNILVTGPAGDKLQKQVITKENGTYFFNFIANSSGVWNIEITWDGNQIYDRCKVNRSFIVYRKLSNITLHLDKTSYVVGENVKLKGVLYPNLKNKKLKIKISMDKGETWQDLSIVETGENGEFIFDWQPETAGTCLISVVWNGNNEYSNATVFAKLEIFKSFKKSSISLGEDKAELLIFSNVSILEYEVNPEALLVNLKLKTESISLLKLYIEKRVYESYNASPSSTLLLLKSGYIRSSEINEDGKYYILEYVIEDPEKISEISLAIISWNLELEILDSESKPLSHALVVLQSLNDYFLNYSAVSDSGGKVIFSNVPGGYYNVTVYYWGENVKEETLLVKDNAHMSIPTKVGFYRAKYNELVEKYRKLEVEHKNLIEKYSDLEERYQKLTNQLNYFVLIIISLSIMLLFLAGYLVTEFFL